MSLHTFPSSSWLSGIGTSPGTILEVICVLKMVEPLFLVLEYLRGGGLFSYLFAHILREEKIGLK